MRKTFLPFSSSPNVIVFGRKAIYFRRANPVPCAVKVLHYPDEKDNNLLSEEVSDRIQAGQKRLLVLWMTQNGPWRLPPNASTNRRSLDSSMKLLGVTRPRSDAKSKRRSHPLQTFPLGCRSSRTHHHKYSIECRAGTSKPTRGGCIIW